MLFLSKAILKSIAFTLCLLSAWQVNASDIQEYYRETWKFESSQEKSFSLSVFAFENSNWTREEIKNRIERMNLALKGCGYVASEVHFYAIKSAYQKVRVDEYDKVALPDGMKRIASKVVTGTHFNFFYFENYLESFSSGGVFPMAIIDGVKGVDPKLYRTAWFPFQTSARRQGRSLPYSEEAHELGHLLLKRGHDTTGLPNIMADRSSIRNNEFLPEQCSAFQLPQLVSGGMVCSALAESLRSTFRRHFHTYNLNHYMTLYCVRNTKNLYSSLESAALLDGMNAYAVYLIHQNEGQSLKPKAPRTNGASWSNHAFLVVDGLVLDQDFTRHPIIIPLEEYLDKFWGDEGANLIFQVRHPEMIGGYTNLEIRDSIRNREFQIFNRNGLISFIGKTSCATKTQ